MSAEISNFVDIMYRAYRDNAQVQHLARDRRGRSWSTMPTTSFVYNFFIYNSIYQFDWKTSLDKGKLCHLQDEKETDAKVDTITTKEPPNERKQQESLEKFMKNICKQSPQILAVAFRPISRLDDLNGSWTQISSGQRISEADGVSFFRRLSDLGCLVRSAIETQDGIVVVSKAIFKLIKECRFYVYQVRNNIFHGSKSLGQIGDRNQKTRLAHYDLFLKCLLHLFFLCHDQDPLPEPYSMLFTDDPPPPNRSRRTLNTLIHISQSVNRYSKPGDNRLISWILENDSAPVSSPKANSALFYPSAGNDIVTPTIIGMPHCRDFYYYDIYLRELPSGLIQGIEDSFRTRIETRKAESEDLYLFDVDGISRTIHWVHRDNKDFLERNILLTYYFHRGDGEGEGGAWQPWDSDLIPKMLKMASNATNFRILTDGVPGGIHPELKQSLEEIPPWPISSPRSRRPYYFGVLSHSTIQRLKLCGQNISNEPTQIQINGYSGI